MKKILIVNYGFPPNDGIGGRRWAKYCKYLLKLGYQIHVIQAEYHTSKQSPWAKDVESNQIIRYFLPLKYPAVFSKSNFNVIDKIKYRFLRLLYSLTTKKRIFDRTFLWEKQYCNLLEKIVVKENIKNIIVTGAPFYLFYYTALFAEKFQGLNLIADYRDPWIDAVNYGMNELSEEKREYEVSLQNMVAEKFSYITAPNQFLLDKIKSNITIKTNCKFVELPHVYDKDDIVLSQPVNKEQGIIKIVYGGTVYLGSTEYLEKFSNVLDGIKQNSTELYSKIRFEFYTPDAHMLKMFDRHRQIVLTEKPIGEEIFKKVANADFCMIILSDHNKDYITTKFIEFSTLKKPFFYVGALGYVSDYIIKNNLGFVFDSENKSSEKVTELFNNAEPNFNREYNYQKFSAEAVVEKIITLLN